MQVFFTSKGRDHGHSLPLLEAGIMVNEHNFQPAFECKRVDCHTIAHYFQKKLQNKPKVKATKGKQLARNMYRSSSSTDLLPATEENFVAAEPEEHLTQCCSTATTLEAEPSLRPRSFSEANTRILERMKQRLATPTRKISIVGDSTTMSEPTNMPYQPPNKAVVGREKLKTWKRNVKSKT